MNADRQPDCEHSHLLVIRFLPKISNDLLNSGALMGLAKLGEFVRCKFRSHSIMGEYFPEDFCPRP
jgi:hypothetical protein